jgi:hypothetical protein
MTTFAEDETNRNFILVATVLQKLGNFQLFDKHEPYFYLLNEDIISFIPQMKVNKKKKKIINIPFFF